MFGLSHMITTLASASMWEEWGVTLTSLQNSSIWLAEAKPVAYDTQTNEPACMLIIFFLVNRNLSAVVRAGRSSSPETGFDSSWRMCSICLFRKEIHTQQKGVRCEIMENCKYFLKNAAQDNILFCY